VLRAVSRDGLPRTTWLVYGMFYMLLLDEEGVLDNGMVVRFMALVGGTVFKTLRNRAPLEADTWRAKFGAAWRMWGRPDLGDRRGETLFRERRAKANRENVSRKGGWLESIGRRKVMEDVTGTLRHGALS
jgi:hypothetical protein